MNPKKLLYIGKICCKIAIWLVLISFIAAAWQAKQFFNANPIDTYETEQFESLPDEALKKIEYNKTLIRIVWAGILITWIYLTLDYFYDPPNHFMSKFIPYFKKISSKLEDDEDEDE